MSKFNFKSIFIKDDEEDVSKNIVEQPKASSLESTNQFPNKTFSKTTASISISEGVLNQVIDLYEKGFDSLNKPGYDFYEFFKSLHSVNDFSVSAYKMAYQMGKTLNPSLDQKGLIQSADYYISEINKVYENYKSQGETKKSDIVRNQANERTSSTNEIASIENQINGLKNQILQLEENKRKKEEQLSAIDSKYQPELKLIDEKLLANNNAKDIITNKINTVKHGVLTNL